MKWKCIGILTLLIILPFSSCMKEEFGGIGVEVPTGHGKVTKTNPYVIASVFKGGSGESAGLRAGDEIVKIDGRPILGLEYEYIVQNLLRGKVGSTVTLEVARPVDGEKTFIVFRISRIKIILQD